MLQPSRQRPEKIKTSTALVILLFVFLAGFAVAFFYFRQQKTNEVASVNTNTDTLKIPAPQEGQVMNKPKAPTNSLPGKEEKTQPAATKNNPEIKPSIEKTVANPEENTTEQAAGAQYKIISKAYFHNEPDESTRRNAFVNHWNNSHTTLTALDEKNGFIYVVFQNDLKQTSKGWLRKKDLRVIQ